MKSFTKFLMENKKQYAFRVKLACECTKDQLAELKFALDKYKVAAISEPKSSPIAEKHTNFEHLKNVRITTLDILTDYPANPIQIREMIRDSMKISEAYIMVTTPGEEANALPIAPINADKALLDTHELSAPDPKSHELVGLKRLEALLKDTERHDGIQYKGVNDEIQVSAPFKEKPAKFNTDLPVNDKGPMGQAKIAMARGRK